MKPHAQSLILLLLTLAIGVLLGALLQSALRENRLNHIRFLRSEVVFIEQVEQAIRPENAKQAEQIRAVLADVAPELTESVKQHRDSVRDQFNQLEQTLQPLLSEEQMLRLHRRLHPPRMKREGADQNQESEQR